MFIWSVVLTYLLHYTAKAALGGTRPAEIVSKLEKMYQDQIVKYHSLLRKWLNFLNALLIKAHMILFDERVEITEEESGFLSDYLFSVEIWESMS